MYLKGKIESFSYPQIFKQKFLQNEGVTGEYKKIQKFREVLGIFINSLKIKKLSESFQSIRHYSNSLRNKQLIYAAINKKQNPQKNQPLTTRKIRQQTKIHTMKKQSEQSFFFNNDDISTIKNETFDNNSITYSIKMDLDFFQQFGRNRQNNFIGTIKKIQNKPKTITNKDYQFTHKKVLNNDCQSIQTSKISSRRQNIQLIDSINLQNSKQIYQLKNTIFIESKIKKQSKSNETIQQIFVIRQSPRKRNNYCSMPSNSICKFIQIPLKSQKFKVFQYKTTPKKSTKSTQSLETKISSKTCFDDCRKNSVISKCKYCQMIEKSNQIIRKIKHSDLCY